MLVDLASTGKIATVLSTSVVSQYEDVLFRPEHRMGGWADEDLFALVDSLLVPALRVQSAFSVVGQFDYFVRCGSGCPT